MSEILLLIAACFFVWAIVLFDPWAPKDDRDEDDDQDPPDHPLFV